MFEVGSKVVCIKDTDDGGNTYDLALHGVYTVRRFEKGITEINYDYIAVYSSDYLWETTNFIPLLEYRKLKINKLKKRICSKDLIK